LFKLSLEEVTPALPDVPAGDRGRLFLYTPELRGSNGIGRPAGDQH